MAILGIALVVLIELFSGALRLGRISTEHTQVINFARLKMEEVLLLPTLKEGIEEGDFSDKYHWQLEIKKAEVLKERYGEIPVPFELYQIKLRVNWKAGLKEKNYTIETYKFSKEFTAEQKI